MKTLHEAVRQLKRRPNHPVRATVDGMTVEVRVVSPAQDDGSAAELFAQVGAWQGESTEEMLEFLARARRGGSQRPVPEL